MYYISQGAQVDVEAAKAASETAAAHVSDSLKWWIGSSGTTAALLVVTLKIQPPNLSSGAAVVYMVAAGVAVGCVLAALFAAASVLCTERIPAPVLAQREFDCDRVAGPPLSETKADPDVKWIQDDRGPALLGTAASVTELIQRTQRGSAEDRTEAFGRLGLIESALHLHRMQSAFRTLIRRALGAAVLFVASVALLVALPYLHPQPNVAPVTRPIPVVIYVVDQDAASIPVACGTSLKGIAVGGTLDNPQLVIYPSKSCGPMRLDDASGLVVLPR